MKSPNNFFFTKITPISEIRKGINDIPNVGGVYKHFVDKEGLKYLDGVYPTKKEITSDGIEVYLLYIGKAKNLLERYEWHLGMKNTSQKSILGKWLSTLRHSYMANHKNITCLSEQEILNDFMDKHTYSQYMITKGYDSIEEQLIKENELPLNVKDNFHSFVQTNRERRKAIYNKYTNEYGNIDAFEHESRTRVNSIFKSRKSSGKIEDKVLREFARKAEQKGIKNKSNFLRWFRDLEEQSAAQNRLYKAWEERYSDNPKND